MLIDERVTIANRTVNELYALITRWDLLLPRIDPSISELTMTPPDGPVAVGTRFVEKMKMLGLPVTIDARITALRPPTGYDYDATSDGLVGRGTMTLRDLGNGSVEFHVKIEMDPTTLRMRLVMRVLGWNFRKAERARLARMKQMLDSGALQPPVTGAA